LGALQGQLSQGKLDETRKGLEAWEVRFRGTDASTYAKFIKADLYYRTSDYVQAAQIYGDIGQTGRPEPTRPLALSAQISSEEMAGHVPQAQSLAQTFLDQYPDHFLAAPTYMTQARLAELAGNPAAASAIYERIILLYPQSPWTALAKARSQTLSKK
jgi:outer membrane protein assembly factor BamD (BamD/ComL family)